MNRLNKGECKQKRPAGLSYRHPCPGRAACTGGTPIQQYFAGYSTRTGKFAIQTGTFYLFAFVLSLLIVFLPMVAAGQSILLEGQIVDKEELTPLTFSHIVKNEQTAGVTSLYAEFSLMVHPHDTLVISHIGYKKYVFIVPEDAPVRLDTILFMTKDTTLLQEVKIYSFPSEREFKRQMMATDGLTKELIHAQNNVYQSQQLYKYGVVPKMDALDNHKTFMNGPQPVVFFATNSSVGLGMALKKAFTSQSITFLPKRSTPLKDVKLTKEVSKEDSVVQEKIIVSTQEEKE